MNSALDGNISCSGSESAHPASQILKSIPISRACNSNVSESDGEPRGGGITKGFFYVTGIS